MYLFILVKSTESYFFNIFPQGSRSNCAIWKCSTRLILVNFWFLKSAENFLQHSANLNFVAIWGGFSPFWPQIDWTINATLRNLLLTNNKITHIESIFFCTYDNAKTLDLARNLLTEIEFNNVIWPSIRSIGLDNNYSNFIETDKLIALGNVVITVWGYPCHRDMELCWLSHCHYKMGMTEAFWSKYPYSWMIELCGDMICNSPEGTKEYFNQGNR